MFDFRYHVASLAAVFLALVIGILVGIGLSGRGLLDEAERSALNQRISDLQDEKRALEIQTGEELAGLELARDGYRALVDNRLAEKRVAVLFIGPLDPDVSEKVEQTVDDADGSVVRLLAITAPLPGAELRAALAGRPDLDDYTGETGMNDLGRALGTEFVNGGETPLWDTLAGALVAQRGADGDEPAHAVVVCRTALPQQGRTARLLSGLYAGIDSAATAVGVEKSNAPISAIDSYRRKLPSSVDAVDRPIGQIALAVLLAGGRPGHYGIKREGAPAVPEIEPLPPPATE
jgi:hypothetical protein